MNQRQYNRGMSINFVDETSYGNDMAELNEAIEASPFVTSDSMRQGKIDFESEDDPFGIDVDGKAFDNSAFFDSEITTSNVNGGQAPPTVKTNSPFNTARADEFMSTLSRPFETADSSRTFETVTNGHNDITEALNVKTSFDKKDDDFGGFGSSSSSDKSSKQAEPANVDVDKKLLLNQIARYRSNWPYLEQEIQFPVALHKKTPEKLQEILDECSAKVQNRNATKCLKLVFNTIIGQVESLCTSYFTSIELDGFAKACETNEMIQDSLLELEIKYMGKNGPMAPEARLILGLLTTAVATHRNNKMRRRVTEACRSYADPLPQYSDL